MHLAAITIRNLDDTIQLSLKRRAAANNRSMEAEARAILTEAVSGLGLGADWITATEALRGGELFIPERSVPRDIDVT